MRKSIVDRKPVAKRPAEELISDLTKKDRKAMEEKIKMLHYTFKITDGVL